MQIKKKLNVGFLITARLKSERLKKKLILKIKGKTILDHLIERLKQSKKISKIIICTSDQSQDKELEVIAKKNHIDCFFGHKDDVIQRLFDACQKYKLDYALNITGDCPFVDPYYADKIVDHYLKTNADLIRQFDLPHGVFCYGIKISALKKILEIKDTNQTEVWGKYFTDTGYFNVNDLKVANNLHRRPDLRMTLDYKQDYIFFKAIFDKLYNKDKIFSLTEIINLLNKKNSIVEINERCSELFRKRYKSQGNIRLKNINKIDSVAVVGCGSIGQRHIKNLQKIGFKKLSALRTNKGYFKKLSTKLKVKEYKDWKSFLKLDNDIAIISNPSSLHLKTVKKLLNHAKGIFIEKPFSHNLHGTNDIINLIKKNKIVSFVGNNLLFHPIIKNIKNYINTHDMGLLISMQIQAGQYLPDWHSYEDYKKSYFSKEDLGGGVLLTLIHEIETALTFAGNAREVFCYLKNYDSLNIEVESQAYLMIKHTNDTVSSIHLDYVQKTPHRSGLLTFENGWISYDFNKNIVISKNVYQKKEKIIWEDKKYNYNTMYVDELKKFVELTKQGLIIHENDAENAIESIKVVEAAKKSNSQKRNIVIEKYNKTINF